MILLIGYDLIGRERPSAYEAMKNAIESHALDSIRPLYSQWFVETSETPDQWVEYLETSRVVDKNDRVFICQVRRPYSGWLTEDDWAWLSARIDPQ